MGSLGAALYGWYLTKRAWTTRKFHKYSTLNRNHRRRVLLSLNTVDENGKLLLRTLFEKNLDDILLKNGHAVGIVLRAMKVQFLGF